MLGTPTGTWGSAYLRTTAATPGPVAVDTDAQGNVYTATNFGVSVSDANGQFLTSIGVYFDQNGENQSQRVKWASHNVDVPREYGKPDLIGESYGLSVTEENGQTVVYVGDAGAYYQPDPAVHFQNGGTAQNTKPASIKKYILTQTGGTTDARWNPSGWKWTLDTSFGTGGAVQYSQNSLISFFGHYIWQGQTVFGLEADPASGSLYYALNGVSGKKLGALDLKAGAEIDPTPAPVNSPSAQQDSAMAYVRGIAVDDRGLVYATTQNTTTAQTKRAIVQIWGKTPTSIADTAAAAPRLTSSTLTWGESTVGYQQPDLLDYVVKYRKVGDTTWTAAPVSGGAATSTALGREINGLTPDTEYEAIVTPFNEAGSGDPAQISWRTEKPAPKITVTKTGNGVTAATQDAAVNVAAGSDVAFAYTITNAGNVPVSDVALKDSVLGDVDLPSDFDGTLDPEESVTAQATGPVAAGDYQNTATATGVGNDEELSATADWYGFGVTTGLTVVKTGNGVAAGSRDAAVNVAAGSDVAFAYTITNAGNVPVSDVALKDSVLGDVELPSDFDGTLDPEESVTAQATGPVAAGDYQNTATATGVANDEELSATADWYGFGVTTGLTVVKTGNGKTATTKDAAIHVTAGSDVSFTYTVTNDGNAPVNGVALTDSELGDITLAIEPSDFTGVLAPGASVTFEATGPVAAGPYKNTADANGTVPAIDTEVSASTDWYGHGDKKETPVDPVNPVEPVDPGNPENPENPEEPKNPADNGPKSPENAKDDLASTGGSTLLPFAVGAGALIAAGGVLILLRRRSANKLD